MKNLLPQPFGERLKEGVKLAFGGLSSAYYTRQAIIGLGLAVVLMWLTMPKHHPSMAHVGFIVNMLVNAALYPYARFVYEQVVDFVLGGEELFANSLLGSLVKLIMMLMCFMLATLLAPLGLLYLYYIQTQDDENIEALAASVKEKMNQAKMAVQEAVEKVKDAVEEDESFDEKVKEKAKKIDDDAPKTTRRKTKDDE